VRIITCLHTTQYYCSPIYHTRTTINDFVTPTLFITLHTCIAPRLRFLAGRFTRLRRLLIVGVVYRVACHAAHAFALRTFYHYLHSSSRLLFVLRCYWLIVVLKFPRSFTAPFLLSLPVYTRLLRLDLTFPGLVVVVQRLLSAGRDRLHLRLHCTHHCTHARTAARSFTSFGNRRTSPTYGYPVPRLPAPLLPFTVAFYHTRSPVLLPPC